jgi:hypothetical protein
MARGGPWQAPQPGGAGALEAEADAALRSRDPARLSEMEARLGLAVERAGPPPPLGLLWRWAEVAARQGEAGLAFERWQQAHEQQPRNEWYVARVIETGVAAERFEDLLPHVPFVMPLLLARGGTLPDGLRRSLLRLATAVLTGAAGPVEGDSATLARYLLLAHCLAEPQAPPRQPADSLLPALLALRDSDGPAFAEAAGRLDALLFPEGCPPDCAVPAVLLYLAAAPQAPRPDLAGVLRAHLPRLGLHQLEQVFARPENLEQLPALADLLGGSLPGVLLVALEAARGTGEPDPADLLERLRAALRLPGDNPGRHHEIRLAEDWVARLEAELAPVRPAVPAVIAEPCRPLAVCLSGPLRGAALVRESWAGAFGDVEPDVYVVTSRWRGLRETRPGTSPSPEVLPRKLAAAAEARRIGGAELVARYPALTAALARADEVTEGELRALFPRMVAGTVDEDDLGGAVLPVAERELRRAHAVFGLCAASGRRYAQVLRMRPDMGVLRGRLGPLLAENLTRPPGPRLVWTDSVLRFDRRAGFIVGDRAALGSPEAMGIACGLWDRLHLARPGLSGLEGPLQPGRALAFHLASHGMRLRKLPVHVAPPIEAPPPDDALLREAVAEDARGRMDALDRAFLGLLGGGGG